MFKPSELPTRRYYGVCTCGWRCGPMMSSGMLWGSHGVHRDEVAKREATERARKIDGNGKGDG